MSIHYVEGPKSGPPLLLLHAHTARWRKFLPIIPALSLRWHLFALDLRGHGKSGRTPGQYRIEDYTADVIAFLEDRFAEPVVLLGHSMGGHIAAEVAVRVPTKVRAVVVGDIPLRLETGLALQTEALTRFHATLRDLIQPQRSMAELARLLDDPGVRLLTILGAGGMGKTRLALEAGAAQTRPNLVLRPADASLPRTGRWRSLIVVLILPGVMGLNWSHHIC